MNGYKRGLHKEQDEVCDVNKQVEDVANRPRLGCYSPARSRFSYAEVAEGSAGQAPAERGGLRHQGRLKVYIGVISI